MKKTYINPEIMIVRIRLHKMIAQSPNATLNPNATMSNGDFASRGRNNFWDDEDDY